jgi:hypothetical protein
MQRWGQTLVGVCCWGQGGGVKKIFCNTTSVCTVVIYKSNDLIYKYVKVYQ